MDETIKAFETRNEKCDIMIVQMCRPNDFRGGSENQVCNYFNVTKVWFNNDLPEINALRSRFDVFSVFNQFIISLSYYY